MVTALQWAAAKKEQQWPWRNDGNSNVAGVLLARPAAMMLVLPRRRNDGDGTMMAVAN